MRLIHVLLALLVVVIWAVAFIATRLALDDFSPPQLMALRFAVAAVPALFLARPPVPWPTLVAIALPLFVGQFLFQFFGMTHGTPPGMSAVVVHTQAFFTVLFAVLFLGERPTARQCVGMALALAGLLVITTTAGEDLAILGLALTVISAVSWGVGNILVKQLPSPLGINEAAWLSLIPPLPALALSAALDGPAGLVEAVAGASWTAVLAVLYLGVISTTLAFAIWGRLLHEYPAAKVAPFALLIPFVAAYASSLVFDERFGILRLVGIALVSLGLAVIVLPIGRAFARAR